MARAANFIAWREEKQILRSAQNDRLERRDEDDMSFSSRLAGEKSVLGCGYAALCYSSRQYHKRSDETGSLILRGALKSRPLH
jgi:hypothetical protein